MLVLLIIFMVAAPLATVDVKVDLPASNASPQQKPDEPIYVSVKADKSVAIGNKIVPTSALGSELDAASGNDKEQRIFIRADKTVDYDTLMQTMNKLREAGYLKIALVGLEGAPQP